MHQPELLPKLGWVLLGILVAGSLPSLPAAKAERATPAPELPLAVLDLEQAFMRDVATTEFLKQIEREEKESASRFVQRVREIRPDEATLKKYDRNSQEWKDLERDYYAKLNAIDREEKAANQEFGRRRAVFGFQTYERIIAAVRAIAREKQLRLVLRTSTNHDYVRNLRDADAMLSELVVVSEKQDITQDVVRRLAAEHKKP